MSAGRGRTTELSAAAVPDLEATGTNSSVRSRGSQKRWSNTRYTGLKDEELPKIKDKMQCALTAVVQLQTARLKSLFESNATIFITELKCALNHTCPVYILIYMYAGMYTCVIVIQSGTLRDFVRPCVQTTMTIHLLHFQLKCVKPHLIIMPTAKGNTNTPRIKAP